jgi:lysophospholipase L1-like esterase
MIDMAKANHIRVVLSAIMPCNITANKRDLQRSARIATVNVALQQLAAAQRITFVDYGAVLANSDGGIQKIYANDGLHPNRDGYAAMKPLVDKVIAQNLK